jgi:hypothetical protein
MAPEPAAPCRRPLFRRVVSRTYVHLVNALVEQRVRYYNGTVLHRTELVQQAIARGNVSDNFTYQTELICDLLSRGHTYTEVATPYAPRRGGESKAFKRANVVGVWWSLVRLCRLYRQPARLRGRRIAPVSPSKGS